MRAIRVSDAVKCPHCYEIIDPDECSAPEAADTWRCPDCGYITDDGPDEIARCRHEPPETVKERCPECGDWQDPQTLSERKQCPLCDSWVSPEDGFEAVAVYRCGECESLHDDRDEAMECCR